MATKSATIELGMDELRAIGGWAADCAERALAVYEARVQGDGRPRAAIEGVRGFSGGEKRTTRLRVLSMDAYRASRETADPAAAAAALSACLAASSAYTHPLADVDQTKHIVGPAAHAALALELAAADRAIGDGEVHRAGDAAPSEARAVLSRMPARGPGTTRIDELMYVLDAGLRSKA